MNILLGDISNQSREKSKTAGLLERRASSKPSLLRLQLVSKIQLGQIQSENTYAPNILEDQLQLGIEPNSSSSSNSVSLVPIREIDKNDRIFSPLHNSSKVILRQQEQTRVRLKTEGFLSANDKNDKEFPSLKPQLGAFQRHYKLGKKIGEGAHSVVKECSRIQRNSEESLSMLAPMDRQLVVKIVKYRDTECLFQLLQEEKIMNEFREHPCLSRKVDFLLESNKKTGYLVMEKAQGCNLTELLQHESKLIEQDARGILRQVLSGILALHEKGICHRDITNNNIIYNKNDKSIKIIDFSVSKQLRRKSQMLWTNTGSVGFMAPEIFTDATYNMQVDMWSLGVVAHSLLTGYLPFYQAEYNQHQLIKSIIKGKVCFKEIGKDLSVSCIDFLLKCLEKDPAKRLTPAEALVHPWIGKMIPQQLAVPSDIETHSKCLIVHSMSNIDEPRIQEQKNNNFDFEYIYLQRFQEFNDASKYLRCVNN